MTDAAALDRESAMIAAVGDPMATAVLAAADPWDAYRAACRYDPYLDDPNLPNADGLYIAWVELTPQEGLLATFVVSGLRLSS